MAVNMIHRLPKILSPQTTYWGATHARCPFLPILTSKGTPSTHLVTTYVRGDKTREKVYIYFQWM